MKNIFIAQVETRFMKQFHFFPFLYNNKIFRHRISLSQIAQSCFAYLFYIFISTFYPLLPNIIYTCNTMSSYRTTLTKALLLLLFLLLYILPYYTKQKVIVITKPCRMCLVPQYMFISTYYIRLFQCHGGYNLYIYVRLEKNMESRYIKTLKNIF